MTKTYKEYAEALFALALENEAADEYSSALNTVRAAFEGDAEYTDFLACYAIPVRERTAAIAQAFEGISENVLSFLQLLCEHGQIKCFFDIADEFSRLLLAYRSMAHATVYSVVELTDAQKTALRAKLEKLCGRTVSLGYAIDKSIVGGLYIDLDGSIIDGSIRHRLHEVREVIDK